MIEKSCINVYSDSILMKSTNENEKLKVKSKLINFLNVNNTKTKLNDYLKQNLNLNIYNFLNNCENSNNNMLGK